jgi:hypothetical protein
VTIFLGCGIAAKYREGGGNFSVPLQWMLGLRRPKLDAIWLEFLPSKMMGQPITDFLRHLPLRPRQMSPCSGPALSHQVRKTLSRIDNVEALTEMC